MSTRSASRNGTKPKAKTDQTKLTEQMQAEEQKHNALVQRAAQLRTEAANLENEALIVRGRHQLAQELLAEEAS